MRTPAFAAVRCIALAALLFTTSIATSRAAAQSPARDVEHDVIIRGGRIVDGTGAPAYRADLAVRNGRISAIGRLDSARAKRVIDAKGRVVTPGFIDMMGQSGESFINGTGESAMNLFTQGITTINAGEGASSAPLTGEAARTRGWSTMREFFRKLEQAGTPINVAQSVGHTQIRRIVIGDSARQATPAELKRMKGYVEEAMQAGAIGLSTSLIYPPAIYATEEEITALAAVAGRYGGRYFTHMRNEGDRLIEAIDEALRHGPLLRFIVRNLEHDDIFFSSWASAEHDGGTCIHKE